MHDEMITLKKTPTFCIICSCEAISHENSEWKSERKGAGQMQKYRLAVCEDDETVRDEICRVCDRTLTEENIEHDIIPFSSAEELENVLKTEGQSDDSGMNRQPFDLLILDIKLENKTGMELAKEVRSRDERVSILFVTGYAEYALEGYEVQPIQFLMKPLNWSDLKRALMTDWRRNHSPRTVFLEKGRKKVRLNISSILYVETDGSHGVQIALTDGSVKFPAGIAEMERMLPEGQFIRCHNSYIVNLEHVRECSSQSFRMDNGCQNLPVSRKYYNDCQNAFVSYKNR